MSINRVVISGNLTRDPELKATNSGTHVLTFGVAVNDRRRNQQTGEWEDVPNFIDCTMFGARAESLHRYLSKGTKVAIEGKLRYRAWEAQDGSRRSKLEVVVDEIEFLSRGQGQGQGQGYDQQQYPQQGYSRQSYAPQAPAPAAAPAYAQPVASAPAQTTQPGTDFFSDEDIPF